MFMHKRMPAKTIRKEAKKLVVDISKWFVENPKRRVCRAELWYGAQVTIRKNHVEEDIDKATKAALK